MHYAWSLSHGCACGHSLNELDAERDGRCICGVTLKPRRSCESDANDSFGRLPCSCFLGQSIQFLRKLPRSANRRHCASRSFAARISRSPQRSAAPRVVALDERQHLYRGHQARSRLDASRGRGRRHHLRGRHRYAAGGSASAHLHDAGVEAGFPLRRRRPLAP